MKDNLTRWRDGAEIDWFSHFIRAWIPFNAWMTDAFGDLRDIELLDHVKAGNNVVYNRIVPMLDPTKDLSQEAQFFRLQVGELHRLLQSCLINGRRGPVSFERVDLGNNPNKDGSKTRRNRVLRVQRDVPQQGCVTASLSPSKSHPGCYIQLSSHDRVALEDHHEFKALNAEYRAILLTLFETVAPRRTESVLAAAEAEDYIACGETRFTSNSAKLFSATLDVVYSLRNALFHGSITPNDQHNEIYRPAYHIVMRFVKCTL